MSPHGGYYVLDDLGNAQPCGLMEWARFLEAPHARRVAETFVQDVRVSTVFLGLDHDFSGHGPPILWETMIFGGPHAGWQARYSSAADARAGHQAAVAWLQGTGEEP